MAFGPLFTAMLKEEWRMHSTMFGDLGFFLFPVILTVFAALASLAVPVFTAVMPPGTVSAAAHIFYLIAGVSVGSFGLLGREVMNRRFGQASLLAYSSRSLPISERTIIGAFILKDCLYYFFFWVAPAVVGVAIGSLVVAEIPFTAAPLLLVSLGLSFFLGIAAAFFLSTVYAWSPRALATVIGFLVIAGVLFAISGIPLAEGFLPLAFYTAPAPLPAVMSVLLILLLAGISIAFLNIDFPESSRRYKIRLPALARTFAMTSSPCFVAKDFIDLRRSDGGMGKIVFSFLFPVGIIWLLLTILQYFIPGLAPGIIFAILLGVFTSTFYNWLTEYDLFTSYAFLPVTVAQVVRAKIESYLILNLIPVLFLLVAVPFFGDALLFIPALAAFAGLSLYAVGVTVYLCGLTPNVMLYDARTFLLYIAAIAPFVLILIFLSIPSPWYATAGILLVPAGLALIRKGGERHTSFAESNF